MRLAPQSECIAIPLSPAPAASAGESPTQSIHLRLNAKLWFKQRLNSLKQHPANSVGWRMVPIPRLCFSTTCNVINSNSGLRCSPAALYPIQFEAIAKFLNRQG